MFIAFLAIALIVLAYAISKGMKSFENLGNIPILQMSGRSSRTYLTLRAIQHGGLPYR
jgi:hypothetical protein